MKLGDALENVRVKKPLIHNIVNGVSIHDCANVTLAIGASPIMADDPEEAREVTGACAGLVLNLGMPTERKVDSMLLSGKMANELGLPVVLDPVGVGVSSFRRRIVQKLMREIRFSVIRGNASEIKTIARLCDLTGAKGEVILEKGVDVSERDALFEKDFADAARMAMTLSKKLGALVVISGEQDVVANGEMAFRVENGSLMMRGVTGMGCQLSSMVGAFLAANPGEELTATIAAVTAMGVCGEIGEKSLKEGEGLGTYRIRVHDAISLLNGRQLEEQARYQRID